MEILFVLGPLLLILCAWLYSQYEAEMSRREKMTDDELRQDQDDRMGW